MRYYCNITKEQEDMYVVEFPDMTNVTTYGTSVDDALKMAKEALEGVLEVALDHGYKVPLPKYKSGYPVEINPQIAFALNLRKARADKTQQEVARVCGMTYQQYQRLENPRKANPTINTIYKLEKALGHSFLSF